MTEHTGIEDSHEKNSGEGKSAEIVVNGELRYVLDRTINYEQVVELAFPGMIANPDSTFTVLYRKTDGRKSEGSLVAGTSVKAHKQGSSFSVTHSIRS